MKKPIHIVKRLTQKTWVEPKHDIILTELVENGLGYQEIIKAMGFKQDTIYRKVRKHGLKIAHKPNHQTKAEKCPPIPKDKPNPIELAKIHIPGFNPETMCIHHPGNRIERISLDEIMRRVL